MDARALLESVLKKNVGSSLRFFSCGFSTLKLFTRFLFQLHLCLICWYRLMLNSGSLRLLGRTCFSSSLISFNTLIHVVQKFDQVPLVWNIYEHMIQKRTYPNEVTTQTMIIALCKEGNLQKYVEILDQIHGKRCSPSVIVNTSLILRILEGRIEDCMVLLKRMLQVYDS